MVKFEDFTTIWEAEVYARRQGIKFMVHCWNSGDKDLRFVTKIRLFDELDDATAFAYRIAKFAKTRHINCGVVILEKSYNGSFYIKMRIR
jgi:tRNA(Ile)-lysidine synthase TilS/MesJ